MTPEPALWNFRCRTVGSSGEPKKRRKKGSSSSGLRCTCSVSVPRVAMLTTAGEATLIIGASEGRATAPAPAEEAAVLHSKSDKQAKLRVSDRREACTRI